jgi:Ca2+-binding RTX toxin-like protein
VKSTWAALAAGAVFLLAPSAAHAFACSYSSATKTMSISLMGNFDGAAIQASSGTNSIFVNGAACGAATLSNTRIVNVTGDTGASQEFLLEMNSPYTNAGGDIDFRVDLGGGANDDLRLLNQTAGTNDFWVFGSSGVNLNPMELVKDADLVIGAGTDRFLAQGDTGADKIYGSGGFGTGNPFARPLETTGGDGADILIGGTVADSLFGEAGNDILAGRAGNDKIDGGAGKNTVYYSSAPGPVSVSLTTGSATGFDGADTLKSVLDVVGSAYADTLTGNSGPNKLSGAGGNDLVNGRQGNDPIDGGPGMDTASFRNAAAGVTANLSIHASSGGDGSDVLTTFENVLGSSYNDTLVGDAAANVLEGGLGNDSINGQGGVDTASYAAAPAGVNVSIATTPGASSGGSGADVLRDVENIAGSAFNDLVYGSPVANKLTGGNGADELHGRGGNDTIGGGAANDKLYGEDGNDNLDGGQGTDICSQGTGTGTIVNCP